MVGALILADGSLVITRPWAGLLAFAVLVGLAGLAHIVVQSTAPAGAGETGEGSSSAAQVAKRRRGIKSLVIGTDGRASTSKTQVVLWTFAVFYAFVFLLLWGRSTRCGDEVMRDTERCQTAAEGRIAFSQVVNRDLQVEYYVLLGLPLVAALAAKKLATDNAAKRSIVKPEIRKDQGGVIEGLSEVMSNDAGQTDLMDFQYFAFNLLTLAYFFFEFLTDPAAGLPDLPPTLLALSGASVAVYTAKKALESGVLPGDKQGEVEQPAGEEEGDGGAVPVAKGVGGDQ